MSLTLTVARQKARNLSTRYRDIEYYVYKSRQEQRGYVVTHMKDNDIAPLVIFINGKAKRRK